MKRFLYPNFFKIQWLLLGPVRDKWILLILMNANKIQKSRMVCGLNTSKKILQLPKTFFGRVRWSYLGDNDSSRMESCFYTRSNYEDKEWASWLPVSLSILHMHSVWHHLHSTAEYESVHFHEHHAISFCLSIGGVLLLLLLYNRAEMHFLRVFTWIWLCFSAGMRRGAAGFHKFWTFKIKTFH